MYLGEFFWYNDLGVKQPLFLNTKSSFFISCYYKILALLS